MLIGDVVKNVVWDQKVRILGMVVRNVGKPGVLG